MHTINPSIFEIEIRVRAETDQTDSWYGCSPLLGKTSGPGEGCRRRRKVIQYNTNVGGIQAKENFQGKAYPTKRLWQPHARLELATLGLLGVIMRPTLYRLS